MSNVKVKLPAWFYNDETGEGTLFIDGVCPKGYSDAPISAAEAKAKAKADAAKNKGK